MFSRNSVRALLAFALLLLTPLLALADPDSCKPRELGGTAKDWGVSANSSGPWMWTLCADGVHVTYRMDLWANVSPDKLGSRAQTVWAATDKLKAWDESWARHVKVKGTDPSLQPVAVGMCAHFTQRTGRVIDGVCKP